YIDILSLQKLPKTTGFLRHPEAGIDVWKLDPEMLYVLEKDAVVAELMRQLRVPDLFASAPKGKPLHAMAAFDNHPTHWIVLHLWQNAEAYSPNHGIHKYVKNAESNGFLFEAVPKAQYSRHRIEERLSREAKEMEATGPFVFQQ